MKWYHKYFDNEQSSLRILHRSYFLEFFGKFEVWCNKYHAQRTMRATSLEFEESRQVFHLSDTWPATMPPRWSKSQSSTSYHAGLKEYQPSIWRTHPAPSSPDRTLPQWKNVLKRSGSLVDRNPEFAKEWHPTKNGELMPYQVTPKSGKKVWWKCSRRHEWEAIVRSRTRGSGCPDFRRKRRRSRK